jgi:hypothetical protein
MACAEWQVRSKRKRAFLSRNGFDSPMRGDRTKRAGLKPDTTMAE